VCILALPSSFNVTDAIRPKARVINPEISVRVLTHTMYSGLITLANSISPKDVKVIAMYIEISSEATASEEYIILDREPILVISGFLRTVEFRFDMIGVKASASIGVNVTTNGSIVVTQNRVKPNITDSLASIGHESHNGATIE